MDELLINACLEERQPSSLPWENGAEKKNKAIIPVDGVANQLDKEVYPDIGHNAIKELDEKYESRHCTRPIYGDSYPGQTGKGLDGKEMKISMYENIDKTQEQINGSYESCLGAAISSMNEDLRSSIKYRGINSTSNRVYGVMGERKHSLAAENLSVLDTKIRSGGIKSPRSPLKISRKMVQESKSGHPLPPIAECTLQERKEKMTTSSCSLLKMEDVSNTGHTYGDVKYGTKKRVPKDSNITASVSHVNQKDKDNINDSNGHGTCKALDFDVDNELDNLLEETADAITYKCPKNDKEKEHKFQGVNTLETNDCKKDSNSVSIHEDSGSNIEGKDRCDKLIENGDKPKSRRTNQAERIFVKKHIYSAENGKGNMIKMERPEVETKKKIDKNVQYNENRQCFDRDDTHDVKKIMDIIDGIEGEVFDMKLEEQNRKESKTKQTKMTKSSKTNLDTLCLGTETEPGRKRKLQRKKHKTEKSNVNRSKSDKLRDEGPTRSPLMDQKDTEYDVFDISPVKNRETISDLEDDDENLSDKYMGKKTAVPKRRQGQKLKKDNVKEMCNVKFSGKQVPKVLSKRGKKKTKVDVFDKISSTGDVMVNREKPLLCQKRVKTEMLENKNYSIESKLFTDEISKNIKKSEKSSKTVDSQPINDTLPFKRKQKRKSDEDKYKLGNSSVIQTPVCGEIKSFENVPKPSASYTIVKHDKTNDTHCIRSVNQSTLVTGTEIDNRITWRNENTSTCGIDKDSKDSMNPHKRAIQQHVIPVNAMPDNDRIAISNDNRLKKVNAEHYEISSRSKALHLGDVKQSAKTNECMTLENTKKTSEMDLGELVYDSDTDTDIISDLTYQQYLIYRPPSEESKEFEFPRPASNRTFIIDSDNDECDENCVDGNISVPRNNVANNELTDKQEKKLSKLQRFVNFITSCFKSKTDE